MKVILLKELQGKGGEGDVIDVNRGFANNFLLTQGYAVKATPGNLKQLEERKKNIAKREETRIADANALAEKLNDATVRVIAQVGEEGVLFGSVTAPLVADAIAEQLDIEIDRRRVELGKPIKMTGTYHVPVSLYRDIKGTVTVSPRPKRPSTLSRKLSISPRLRPTRWLKLTAKLPPTAPSRLR